MEKQRLKSSDLKSIKISPKTTVAFLQVFNGILNLTDTEMNVLAALIDLRETVNLCSTINKKKVAKILDIKDFNTLNNYVKRLKDKKAIIETKDGYEIHPILKCEDKAIVIDTSGINERTPE
jgi:hypothetical protein